MKYLSVCSGIEAASVAWHSLGWTPIGFSEIEPFPSAVLAHRFPNVANYGDMTKHKEWPLEPESIDLLVGGTPCQSFSVAGLRKGLSDPRGGLMLIYLEIAQRLRPQWVVWENVPGVLSSNGGRDFGAFLGALGELGYGYAYRVLDAQWVRTHWHPHAVPQRRRRVFVVGCLGDGAAAAQVLFERESVQRDFAKGRPAREEAPADAGGCAQGGQYWNGEQVAAALTRKGCDDRMPDKERLFAVLQPAGYRWQNNRYGLVSDGTVSALRASAGASGFHEMNHPVVAQPVPYDLFQITAPVNRQNRQPGDPCHTLARDNAAHAAVAFTAGNLARGAGPSPSAEVFPTLRASDGRGGDQRPSVMHGVAAPTITATNDPSRSPQSAEITQQVAAVHASTMTVRRLTPRECERLQGFPDDWTMIPWRGKPADQCPDGLRYKALGNSMAVNCMEWIGARIDALQRGKQDVP